MQQLSQATGSVGTSNSGRQFVPLESAMHTIKLSIDPAHSNLLWNFGQRWGNVWVFV
jgi:hypothetical protein